MWWLCPHKSKLAAWRSFWGPSRRCVLQTSHHRSLWGASQGVHSCSTSGPQVSTAVLWVFLCGSTIRPVSVHRSEGYVVHRRGCGRCCGFVFLCGPAGAVGHRGFTRAPQELHKRSGYCGAALSVGPPVRSGFFVRRGPCFLCGSTIRPVWDHRWACVLLHRGFALGVGNWDYVVQNPRSTGAARA